MPDLPYFDNSKALLRQKARQLRASLDIPTISRDICNHLEAWPIFAKAETVLFYSAFRDEIDLMPIVSRFPEKKWFLPAVEAGQSMVFRRYKPGDSLTEDRYGILSPSAQASPLENLASGDVILLPGLTFDRHGHRLGYGKGYYDRFLQGVRKQNPGVILAGTLPYALLSEKIPADTWDVPADVLVTEQGIFPAISAHNQDIGTA